MNKVTDRIIGELYVGSWHLPDFVGLGYFIEYREFIDETNTIRKEIEDAQSRYLTTTNNRAELLAVIYGLQSVIDNITSQKIKLDQIDFYTTSKYLYNAVSPVRIRAGTESIPASFAALTRLCPERISYFPSSAGRTTIRTVAPLARTLSNMFVKCCPSYNVNG